ncbi:MAG: amidohydrolase family protein, partial [Pseudomonadota bacterium]
MTYRVLSFALLISLVACGGNPVQPDQTPLAGADVTIFPASAVVTMATSEAGDAIAVRDGRILAVSGQQDLETQFPGASVDESFAAKTIVPGLIDPHVHMGLSSLQYAVPLTPPWPMATPAGMVRGLPTRAAFLQRLQEIEATAPEREPLIVYGFHDLVHGDLVRQDLDAITTDRSLIIWHYSSHDFYLNSTALEWAGIDAALHEQFEGVALDDDGELTGRVFEDALPVLMAQLGPILLAPDRLSKGMAG